MTTVAINLTQPEERLGTIPVRLRAAGLDLRFGSGRRSTPTVEVIGSLEGAAAVIAGQEAYTPEVFDACPNLGLVVRVGVGFDAVDVAAASDRGVLVATIPGTTDWGVADHAIGLMIDLAHGISRAADAPRPTMPSVACHTSTPRRACHSPRRTARSARSARSPNGPRVSG